MLESRHTCILLCLVALMFSGDRIHYEAYFTDYYLQEKGEEGEEEEEVQHLGGSFFTALYVPSICSSAFCFFFFLKYNTVSVYLQPHKSR